MVQIGQMVQIVQSNAGVHFGAIRSRSIVQIVKVVQINAIQYRPIVSAISLGKIQIDYMSI